jgi:DNA-binding transcriptional ArsR family regulator
VIRRIDAALVGADSRAAVESAVTTHLAESPLFAFAWVGRPDAGELLPTAWAGDDHHYLDSLDRSLSTDRGLPAVRTALTGDVTAVSTIAEDLRAEPWRTEAVSRGFGSALAVPLGTDDAVLTVYTDRSAGFPDRVQCALCDLGETVADALATAEATPADEASDTGADEPDQPARPVELDLRVEAPDCPLVRLARRVGSRLRHEGTVVLGGSESLTVVRPGSADHDAVPPVDAQLAGPRAVRTLDEDGDGRYGIHLVAPTVPSTVVEAGGWTSAGLVDDEGADLTVTVPTSDDVERLLRALEARFGSVTVTASREAADATGSAGPFRAAARSALTPRQWAVLRSAHLSGFFEWPRVTTGEDVASMLDVSQPTVSRHLRVGQRNLLDLLFDE